MAVFCLASLEYKLDARVRRKARRYKLGDGILKYLIIEHMHSFGELSMNYARIPPYWVSDLVS